MKKAGVNRPFLKAGEGLLSCRIRGMLR
jgi:hypothetical protein